MSYNDRYFNRIHKGFGQVQDTLESYFNYLLKLPTRRIAPFIVILCVLSNIKGTRPFHCYN